MKLAGSASPGLRTGTFTFKRLVGAEDKVFNLTVSALPLGFEENLDKIVKKPKPPVTGVLRDHKNKPVLGPDGRALVHYDEHDDAYQEQLSKVNRLQTVAMVYLSLREDPNVEWDSKEEDFSSKEEFYLAIEKELRSWLSLGELGELIKVINEVSSLDSEAVAGAQSDFL